MSIIIPTLKRVSRKSLLVTWTGLGATDTAQAVDVSDFPDITCQIFGTANGATFTLYGSNDDAKVLVDRAAGTALGAATANWQILTDTLGNNIASAAALNQVLDAPKYVSGLNAGGGGSTSLTVSLICRNNKI